MAGIPLVLATRNKGKVAEMAALLAGLSFTLRFLPDLDKIPEVVEDGNTFLANAVKKATVVADAAAMLSLADDSGLEVDYLGGQPGVYSARFAGEEGNDAANNAKLLALLNGVPSEQRTARFRCAIAIARPGEVLYTAEGTCEGIIGHTAKGEHGFGYDPLFIVPAYGKTFAEIDPATKNRISHRAVALQKAAAWLAAIGRDCRG
jgi:XTP/dITP diphosphohydrolase